MTQPDYPAIIRCDAGWFAIATLREPRACREAQKSPGRF